MTAFFVLCVDFWYFCVIIMCNNFITKNQERDKDA